MDCILDSATGCNVHILPMYINACSCFNNKDFSHNHSPSPSHHRWIFYSCYFHAFKILSDETTSAKVSVNKSRAYECFCGSFDTTHTLGTVTKKSRIYPSVAVLS